MLTPDFMPRERRRAAPRACAPPHRASPSVVDDRFRPEAVSLSYRGKRVRRAIRSAEKSVGDLVSREPLGRSVEPQRSADTVGNVSEVAEGRRKVTVLEGRSEVSGFARADAFDEVLEVRLPFVALRRQPAWGQTRSFARSTPRLCHRLPSSTLWSRRCTHPEWLMGF